jgi:hypothetical protein
MRWPDPDEPDPITDDQVRVLFELLGGSVPEEELEGFLIVCSRLVDEFGGHRTRELADIFRTSNLSWLILVRNVRRTTWPGVMGA